MKKTALITGASSGIGLEMAHHMASQGINLVLVARSKGKLDELKTELEAKHKVKVETIGKDLSLADAATQVYNETKSKNIAIDYLVNNAGFGDFGMFAETDWNKELQMLNLNIVALTHLTKLYVKDMVASHSGRILNVASTAAFQPGPTMAIYFATKAYVLSFSEAIGNELKDSGITVTTLCPGATESGFQQAADMKGSKLFEGKKLPSSKAVAIFGYQAMMKGKPVAIHGMMNTILAKSIGITPRNLVLNITRKLMEKNQ